MVEEPLLEHLLVQPCAVESGSHRQLDVRPQRRVVGGRHYPVMVVTLVQDQPLEHDLAVQEHPVAVDGDRPQTGVTGDAVQDSPVKAEQLDLDFV